MRKKDLLFSWINKRKLEILKRPNARDYPHFLLRALSNFFKGEHFTRGSGIVATRRSGIGSRLGATCTWSGSCTELDLPHRRRKQFASSWRVPCDAERRMHQETKSIPEGWNSSEECHKHRHAISPTQVRTKLLLLNWIII